MLGMTSFFNVQNERLFPAKSGDDRVACPMSQHQYQRYVDVRLEEIERETLAARKAAGAELKDDAGTVYKAFSRLALNFAFPKGIRRPFPSGKADAAAVASGEELETGTYAQAIEKALRALAASASKHLVADLPQNSPKMAAMLERLLRSPGPALVYSQYRSLEGLGIFAEVLKARGFVELDVRGGVVTTPESDFGKPMFVVFGGDHDRADTDVLLDFFNSMHEKLPPQVADAYRKIAAASGAGEEGNMRGKMVRALAITQSGAEGVSLRNVRQVHLLEPYWNDIRAEQVIGRAIRTCSHVALPPEERNVQVFRYVSTIPREMVDASSRIATTDRYLSTDELLLAVAEQKRRLTEDLLALMHRTAIDCRLHAKVHPGSNCLVLHGKGTAFRLDDDLDKMQPELTDVKIGGRLYRLDREGMLLYVERSGKLVLVGRLERVTRDGKPGFAIVKVQQATRKQTTSTGTARRSHAA
jgi:hypothetical protein